MPELADWCGVDLPGRGGAVDAVAIAHVDPERVALAPRAARALPGAAGRADRPRAR